MQPAVGSPIMRLKTLPLCGLAFALPLCLAGAALA